MALTAVLAIPAFLAPPVLSTDVFYYAATGEMAATGAGNPFVATLDRFPQIELGRFVYWTDFPTPYGPIWTSLSALLAWLVPDAPVPASLSFKLVAAAAHLLTALAVFAAARHFRRESATLAVVLYAWNPLVLLESAGNAHNDALAALLAVGAYWLLLRGHGYLGYGAALASVGIKATFAPLAGVYAIRRAMGRDWWSAACHLAVLVLAAVLVLIALYWPYWEGPATLSPLRAQSTVVPRGPLVAALDLLARPVLSSHSLRMKVIVGITLAATMCVGLWALLRALRISASGRPREIGLEMHLTGTTLAVFTLVFSRSYPWYALVPLALLAASWPVRKRSTLMLYIALSAWFFVDYVF